MTEAQLKARMAAERQIIRALCKAAIAAGGTVSYSDGEDWPVKRSKDIKAVMAEVHSTDEAYLLIRDADGNKFVTVFLVYGNDGYDVCSDWSWPVTKEAEVEEFMKPISELADRIESRMTR
jgi:hypothetical protein